MESFFEWLSQNSFATNVLIIAFIVVIIVLIIVFIVAFIQNRPISFWPPSIGAKPDKEVDTRTRSGKRLIGNSPKFLRKYLRVVSDESVFTLMTRRYGIGYTSLEIDCVINNDGSATVTRTVELIAESDITQLDTVLFILTEKDGYWDIKNLRVKSTETKHEVTASSELQDRNKQSVKISFSPPLRPKDVAGYSLVEKLPAEFYSFAHSDEELKTLRKYDQLFGYNDYFGWHINRPTKKFIVRVFLPENWKTQQFESKVLHATASAFPSSSEQREENRRLDFGLFGPEVNRYYLELSIDYPMIGLIYLISWQPIFSES